LGIVALFCGCGGPSAAEREQARKTDGELLLREVQSRADQQAQAEAEAARSACESEIGDFIEALNDLGSRLDVGLNFQSYSDRVGDVRVAYNKINVSALGGSCLDPAADGEDAMNSYIRAYNVWNDCISDLDCSTDSIDSKLQAQWSKASEKLTSANSSFDSVATEVTAKSYTNVVPAQAGQVSNSVYGGAVELICNGDSLPPAAQEPCAKLKVVTTGGVAEDELGDLDAAVGDLNVALGLKTEEG
jgi:hypothetical protein